MKAKLKDKIIVIVATLYLFTMFFVCILKPPSVFSESERRVLKVFPTLNISTLLSGNFMKEFESYTLDQFPLRESFRTIKAISEYNFFHRTENNDVYQVGDHVSKIEYPLNDSSVTKAAEKFREIYDKYLKETGSKVYLSIIPDKNYFLAEENGYLSIDYDKMISDIKAQTDFMEYIDIMNALEISDYYYTDTHWREECITDVAKILASAMGVELKEEYEVAELDHPFHGVYYGQSALPLPAETIYYLTNSLFDSVKVYDHENGKETSIYDMDKAYGNDPYEMFLSGPLSLITIENPNASTDKELIIFRDSFGSSIAPLFVEGYAKITLVDIRYISSAMLDRFIEFNGQDVLFLYSTMVLNNSETLK